MQLICDSCAVHYGSPAVRFDNLIPSHAQEQPLFQRLQHAEIYVSKSIYTSITVPLTCSVELNEKWEERIPAFLHVDTSTEALRIYVPEERRDRELCYLQYLPQSMIEYLKISGPQAKPVVAGVVGCSSAYVASEFLKAAGIIEAPGISYPDITIEDYLNLADDEPIVSANGTTEPTSTARPAISVESVAWSSTYSRTTIPTSSLFSDLRSTAQRRRSTGTSSVLSVDSTYPLPTRTLPTPQFALIPQPVITPQSAPTP